MQEFLKDIFLAVVTAAVPVLTAYIVVCVRKVGDNAAANTETVDFNVYTEDENGENRKEVTGVKTVELPKCRTDYEGRTTIEGRVKIVFRGTGDALDLLQSGERVLKVYTAEQYFGILTREFEIEQRVHAIVPDWDTAVFCPGTVVSADNAIASLEYPVREYRMLYDGKEVFQAEADETA